jgi:hypothetical protein
MITSQSQVNERKEDEKASGEEDYGTLHSQFCRAFTLAKFANVVFYALQNVWKKAVTVYRTTVIY